jgi:hypothetical protein
MPPAPVSQSDFVEQPAYFGKLVFPTDERRKLQRQVVPCTTSETNPVCDLGHKVGGGSEFPAYIWPTTRNFECGSLGSAEAECFAQTLDGCSVGKVAGAAFQVSNTARTEPRPLGERILGQSGH